MKMKIKELTGTTEQYALMMKLVDKKVAKEVDNRNGGMNARFDHDFLHSFLTDKAIVEVNRYNASPKKEKITLETWLLQAINCDWIDFIKVKKNNLNNWLSFDELEDDFEEGHTKQWEKDVNQATSVLSSRDVYFNDDLEMILVDRYKCDDLFELKEKLENLHYLTDMIECDYADTLRLLKETKLMRIRKGWVIKGTPWEEI